jgi:hypothetical protein
MISNIGMAADIRASVSPKKRVSVSPNRCGLPQTMHTPLSKPSGNFSMSSIEQLRTAGRALADTKLAEVAFQRAN